MRCPSCKVDVEPVPPRTIAKVGLVAAYVAMLAVASGSALLLGLNLVLVPAAIVAAFSIGAMARRANAWTCPLCKQELIVPKTVAPAPVVAGRLVSPPPAG